MIKFAITSTFFYAKTTFHATPNAVFGGPHNKKALNFAGLDARHVFPERENCPFSQHYLTRTLSFMQQLMRSLAVHIKKLHFTGVDAGYVFPE